MYKYSCRKCPIRARCIEESSNSDSIKLMIVNAFEARTDTLATWGRLQKDCLLLKAEQEKRKGTNPLSQRLQQVREAKIETGQLSDGDGQPKKSVIRRIKPLGNSAKQANAGLQSGTPDYLQPVSPQKQSQRTKSLRKLNKSRTVSGPAVCWLTLESTKRRIALPGDGGIVLGRFDPNVGIPPDIDLTYEDRRVHLISRRHATIFGRNGRHTIEDLGSNAGVYLNGDQISLGPSRVLEPGDVIRMGNIKFLYSKMPGDILKQATDKDTHHILRITSNGRKMVIAPPKSLVIGRADPQINFVPDVDLSRDGDVSRLVSRRHALIQWRYGQPYVEDLGSGFGTRLRGDLLTLGQSTPLVPGDHIWLAGCVVAYDIDA